MPSECLNSETPCGMPVRFERKRGDESLKPQYPLERWIAAQKLDANRPYLKWKKFADAHERDDFRELQKHYEESTIKTKFAWAIQIHIPPRKLVRSVISALQNNNKPDKDQTAEKLAAMPNIGE